MEEWLTAIGLGMHAAAFRAQGIAVGQLGELTDEDLRELGLTIGERKRFRRALAENPPAALPAPPPAPEPAAARAPPERRPLTVVFVDLVGSSSLAERLDPEDMLEVIRRFRDFSGAAVARYGGQVAQFLGDGILACFGHPAARENDPERAVRAGLDILRDLGGLDTPAGAPLGARIGIATGLVVVGDLFASGAAGESAMVGATPNLAARLQALAPPGGLLVAEATERHVHRLFECEDLGEQALRGFAAPQRVFRVLRERPGARRSRAGPAPFVNRDAEWALLEDRWAHARAGEGAMVLLLGEAGIGKSRLVDRFLAAHEGEGTRVVEIAASPLDEDSALHPFLAHLRAAAGWGAEDPPETRLGKLRAVLGGAGERTMAALAEALGLGAATAGEPSSPAAVKERTLAALGDWLLPEAVAAPAGVEAETPEAPPERRPLLLVVEDAHWLDPTSREFLGRLAGRLAGQAAMLVLTARDAAGTGWVADRDATSVLWLARFGPEHVAGMVRGLLGGGGRQSPPAALGRRIAERTDGVPLFVEEVARALRDRQGRTAPAAARALAEEPDADIPASLHELLLERLDRCGAAAKGLAQLAATIGRRVRRDILAAAAGLPEAELARLLEELDRAGVLRPEAGGGAAEADQDWRTFGHALVRDAAYHSLMRDRRRRLHARAAEALRARDPGLVEQQPELLALHLTEAGLAEEAAPLWAQAGRRSLARSALLEAARLLRRGLAALEALPETSARLERRVELLVLLGPALIGLKGPGSPEAQAAYTQAYDLCRRLPEARGHFPVYWGWWRLSRDFRVMTGRAEALLARAEARGDPALLLQAHHCNWASRYNAGDLCGCARHLAAGLAIYGAGDYRDHAALYGNHDAKVCAHGEMAQLDWMRGRPLNALAEEERSLAWAKDLRHLGSRVHAMDMALLHHSYRRDHATVFVRAEALARFAGAHALADHRAKARIFRGWALAMLGEPRRGLDELEAGLARQREIGTSEDFPVYACLRAEALRAAGQADRAVEALRAAREEFDEIGLRIWLPELCRGLGEAALAADPGGVGAAALAEAAFAEAAALAGEQGAAMLGLRAAASAARLLLRQGRPEEALARLAPARARIAEAEGGGSDLGGADELLRVLEARLGRGGGLRLVTGEGSS